MKASKLLVVSAVSVALFGCGGGDSSPKPPVVEQPPVVEPEQPPVVEPEPEVEPEQPPVVEQEPEVEPELPPVVEQEPEVEPEQPPAVESEPEVEPEQPPVVNPEVENCIVTSIATDRYTGYELHHTVTILEHQELATNQRLVDDSICNELGLDDEPWFVNKWDKATFKAKEESDLYMTFELYRNLTMYEQAQDFYLGEHNATANAGEYGRIILTDYNAFSYRDAWQRTVTRISTDHTTGNLAGYVREFYRHGDGEVYTETPLTAYEVSQRFNDLNKPITETRATEVFEYLNSLY